MIDKYRLPNDNIFMWLGTTEEEINNVLILAGGDLLFLKAVKTIPLGEEEVRKDVETLDYKGFSEKYEVPVDRIDLWRDLRIGVETGKYPPYNRIDAEDEYKSMLRHYIGRLLSVKDPDKRMETLNEIVRYCQRKELDVKRGIQ